MKYIYPVVVSSFGSLVMYMCDKKINPFKKIKLRFGKKKVVDSKPEEGQELSIRRLLATRLNVASESKKTANKWRSKIEWFGRIVDKMIKYKSFLKKARIFLELEKTYVYEESKMQILRKKIYNLPWTSALTALQDYDDSHDLEKLQLNYSTRATTY